jgi:hypothetical protein
MASVTSKFRPVISMFIRKLPPVTVGANVLPGWADGEPQGAQPLAATRRFNVTGSLE